MIVANALPKCHQNSYPLVRNVLMKQWSAFVGPAVAWRASSLEVTACVCEGQAPTVSSTAAAAQNPGLNNRLTRAFGSTATAIINAGADVVANAPNPNPGMAPPASNLVHLLGPVVSDAADLVLAPVPAPASMSHLGSGEPTSISSEVASSGAHAPSTRGSSIEGEVQRVARAPAPAPSLAAAALAQRMPALQGPHGPLEDALGYVAGLPGNLGLLPKLPPPGQLPSSSFQAQQQGLGPQGGPRDGQGGMAGDSQDTPLLGFGRRR